MNPRITIVIGRERYDLAGTALAGAQHWPAAGHAALETQCPCGLQGSLACKYVVVDREMKTL
jgi:hypothetical protein